MISAIVAADEKWGIGKDGKLLVSIPEDLKRFKAITKHNVVVMGRKTWESLPNKPLPDRVNLVITNSYRPDKEYRNTIFCTMDDAKRFMIKHPITKFFVIGGGEIYKQLLPYCRYVYLTKIYNTYDADVTFPNLDNKPFMFIKENSKVKLYNNIQYRFCTYENSNPKRLEIK